MAPNPAFWNGKRVLITGHTGFKGSWLALWLQSLGAQVTGYSLSIPTSPALFEIADVAHGMTSILGDIRDLAHLQRAMHEQRPEVVFHMAAQTLVRHSYQEPVETFSTNVMGTVNVLEAIRNSSGVKAAVIVTSDKCYENREWEWGYREDDAMGGHDPYSNSKGCAELVTASYRHAYFPSDRYAEHGLAIASCRAGNVIGGGDWASDRLIPDILRAIAQGDQVSIRNPNSIRPWQYVLEPLSGYILLAQKLVEDGVTFAEAWNFGPNDEDAKPVRSIVQQMADAWGEQFQWHLEAGQHPHEAQHLKLDCSKAKARLKWRPKWKLEQAIEKICAWHKAHLAGNDMRLECLAQIREYEMAGGPALHVPFKSGADHIHNANNTLTNDGKKSGRRFG